MHFRGFGHCICVSLKLTIHCDFSDGSGYTGPNLPCGWPCHHPPAWHPFGKFSAIQWLHPIRCGCCSGIPAASNGCQDNNSSSKVSSTLYSVNGEICLDFFFSAIRLKKRNLSVWTALGKVDVNPHIFPVNWLASGDTQRRNKSS